VSEEAGAATTLTRQVQVGDSGVTGSIDVNIRIANRIRTACHAEQDNVFQVGIVGHDFEQASHMRHVAVDVDIRRSETRVSSPHVDLRDKGLSSDGARIREEIINHLDAEICHGVPKDTWFRVYLKANLLMPQTYDAGAIFLARTVLEQNDLETLETATRLSPAQLTRLRRTMEAAHHARRIPAGDRAFLERAREQGRYDMSRTITIDDERLCYIWNRFRERAVMVVKALTQRPAGLLTANQWVAGFQTKKCRALLRQFRAQYDRRREGSDKAAAALRRAILVYVDAQVQPPQHRGLLQELFGV
jgi:hypothetical protein